MSTPSPSDAAPRRGVPRLALFGVLLVACALVAGGYVAWAVLRSRPDAPGPRSGRASAALAAGVPSGTLVFRSAALDSSGMVATVPLAAPEAQRALSGLGCDRVHFASGQGVCLTSDRGVVTTYSAVFFGPDLAPRRTLPLSGIPSRTRVSPDGRYAAITVFVSGHSYSPGSFSTQTTLYDLGSGAQIAELEQFQVLRDGQPFYQVDFNFWGVTFARDSNRFYATLAMGGTAYLVEGDIAARTARVVHPNVECPSLAPDNRRVAFKRLTGEHGWQVVVLDLATLAETPLAGEQRSVDDQVEWLDDGHILYALSDESGSATPGENIWILPTDGSAGPRIFQARASSPAVVH